MYPLLKTVYTSLNDEQEQHLKDSVDIRELLQSVNSHGEVKRGKALSPLLYWHRLVISSRENNIPSFFPLVLDFERFLKLPTWSTSRPGYR